MAGKGDTPRSVGPAFGENYDRIFRQNRLEKNPHFQWASEIVGSQNAISRICRLIAKLTRARLRAHSAHQDNLVMSACLLRAQQELNLLSYDLRMAVNRWGLPAPTVSNRSAISALNAEIERLRHSVAIFERTNTTKKEAKEDPVVAS